MPFGFVGASSETGSETAGPYWPRVPVKTTRARGLWCLSASMRTAVPLTLMSMSGNGSVRLQDVVDLAREVEDEVLTRRRPSSSPPGRGCRRPRSPDARLHGLDVEDGSRRSPAASGPQIETSTPRSTSAIARLLPMNPSAARHEGARPSKRERTAGGQDGRGRAHRRRVSFRLGERAAGRGGEAPRRAGASRRAPCSRSGRRAASRRGSPRTGRGGAARRRPRAAPSGSCARCARGGARGSCRRSRRGTRSRSGGRRRPGSRSERTASDGSWRFQCSTGKLWYAAFGTSEPSSRRRVGHRGEEIADDGEPGLGELELARAHELVREEEAARLQGGGRPAEQPVQAASRGGATCS